MTKTTLMEFPCNFPVKIIGSNSPIFLEEVKKIAKKHFSNFQDEDLKQNMSQKSNYLALTVTVLAENQKMLDAFYLDLTKLPDIKMVL
jgi:putative lipoic acid-binding regulatory protein